MNNPYQAPVEPAQQSDELLGRHDSQVGDVKRIAGVSHRSLFSVADQVFVSGLSFATSILIGRTDAATLGVYALVMTLVNFFRSVQGELVTAPFTVYSPRHTKQTLPTYIGSTFAHQALLTAVGVIFVVSVAAGMKFFSAPSELQIALRVLPFAMPIILWHSFARQFCFARVRFGLAMVMDGVIAAIQLAGVFWLANYGQLTVGRVFGVVTTAMIVGLIIWWFSKREKFHITRKDSRAHWVSNWEFSRWALVSQLVGCSTPFILPWAISLTHGEYDTGVFSACVTTLGLSTVFITAVANLLTPLAAQAYAHDGVGGLRRVLWRTAWAYLAVVGAFVVFVGVTGDWLVVLFYGDDFAHTQTICRLLVVSILFNSMSVVAGNGLWAIDKPRRNLPADAMVLAATVIASAMLIPSQGIIGAAMGTLIGATLGMATRISILRTSIRELHTSSEVVS